MDIRNTVKNEKNLKVILSIVLVFILNAISFLLAKIISSNPILFSNHYNSMLLEMLFPAIMIPVTLYFCKLLKLDISSIGIRKKNFMKSFIVGILISFLLVIVFGIHCTYDNIYMFVSRIIYFFICISAVEEIVFRGFVSHTIHENKKIAYLLSGLLFSLSHITFSVVMNDLNPFWFIVSRWFPFTFYVLIHYVLQIIYDRYQNCSGPIFLHFIIDFFGIFAN